MGNSIGCYGLGERLAAAARDGDSPEVGRLLADAPSLARYVSFGALNSPLHFAAAKGHWDIIMLLLQNGADVNSKNIYGQTPLMQACRFGRWEVVQTLLVFGSNVSKAESLGGRTALYYAAAGGHVRCIRLLLADWRSSDTGKEGTVKMSLSSFVNKPTSAGVTALHVAALNGHPDCVHLLLDMGADVAKQTITYTSSSVGSIGAGSTPLHYAACGGDLKCCQLLISRGASRLAMNCNGWLPADVARMWGCPWLVVLLSPKSVMEVPKFTPSSYRSLPLTSVLEIAREYSQQMPSALPVDVEGDDGDCCAVCLEWSCNVAADVCRHQFCVKCALNLCSAIKAYGCPTETTGSIPCPLCRRGISHFAKLPTPSTSEMRASLAPGTCDKCSENLNASILKLRADSPATCCHSSSASLPCNPLAAPAVQC